MNYVILFICIIIFIVNQLYKRGYLMPEKTARKATKVASAPKPEAKKKIVAVKSPTFKETLKKTELLKLIAEETELPKKEVESVLNCLTSIIDGHIKPKGVGKFVLPGLLAITVVKKPATKARKGINPFNGEETIFKAKPARKVVKIKPLKKLKEMADNN